MIRDLRPPSPPLFLQPCPVQSSQPVILVPLEICRRHRHGFAAQEGGPAQGGARAGHVGDGRGIFSGRGNTGTFLLHEDFRALFQHPPPNSHPASRFMRQTPPPQASRVGPCAPLMLTIHCDQHTAAVGRRVHPVVSNAFVFPGLAPLDVGDFQNLAL